MAVVRKLASIQRIVGVAPIEGADKIECVTVLGWQCVTRKGEFQNGELIIYVEVDSILPERPEFEFMRARHFRVRTIKLRKQVSQGICFPLSILPSSGKNWEEGDDVTDALGIAKHDPQLIQEELERERDKNKKRTGLEKFLMRFKIYRNMVYRKKSETWPSFIRKTDEDRIQNMPWICEADPMTSFDTTEKLDGQSATYALKRLPKKFWQIERKYQFFVCSRNIHLKTPHPCSYWEMARKYNIEKVLRMLILGDDFIILQGEIVGPGIQKNRYNLPEHDFYAFNLEFQGNRVGYFTMSDLLGRSIKTVPWIGRRWLGTNVATSIDIAKGLSTFGKIQREGVVMRNELGVSFKIINPDYLLKYDDAGN